LCDLLATVAYPDLSPKFAMKIGKQATLSELDPKGCEGFAADAGLGLPLIRRRVADLCERVGAQIPTVTGALSRSGLDECAVS
jgi:serine/threonine-protein kinase HipA